MNSILNNFFDNVKDFSDDELMSGLMEKLQERGITVPTYVTYERATKFVKDNIRSEENLPLFTKEIYNRAVEGIILDDYIDDVFCEHTEVINIINKGEDESDEEEALSEYEEMPEDEENNNDEEDSDEEDEKYCTSCNSDCARCHYDFELDKCLDCSSRKICPNCERIYTEDFFVTVYEDGNDDILCKYCHVDYEDGILKN